MQDPATQHPARRDRRAFALLVAAEAVIIAIGAFTYVFVRELTEGSPERAIANAHQLLAFEQRLGIDHERTLVGLSLAHDGLRTFVNWIYIWGHWPVILGVASWLFVHDHGRYVWLRNAIFASGMLGFAFFALVPMAPPRLSGLGYADTITLYSSSYRVMQPPDYANLYAAMPSLHFGWDLLVGIALFASTSILGLRVFAVVMPSLMGFAVIATANHWVLDVLVGLGVVTAGVAVSEAVAALTRRHRTAARSRREFHERTQAVL